jgi:hypothetical protein
VLRHQTSDTGTGTGTGAGSGRERVRRALADKRRTRSTPRRASACGPGGSTPGRAAPPTRTRRSPPPAAAHLPGEKDAKLAQKLGQLQPFRAVFPQECMGQLASFWANLTPFSLGAGRGRCRAPRGAGARHARPRRGERTIGFGRITVSEIEAPS